jgi:sugar/nucleoside kinase (ribokinase family)
MNSEQCPPDKLFDLAIAGELNMDLIMYGLPLEMPTERDLLGTGFASTLGSSSAILAHNAATLGLRVQFSTLVGDDDFGRVALHRLNQVGIDTAGAIIDPSITTGVTILLPHGSERHMLTYLGSIAALTVDHLNLDRLAQARHFHLSSLYLQTALHPGLVDLFRFLKSAGLSISMDTNDDPDDKWGPPLHQILPFVDIFLPSEGEICRMAGGTDLDTAMQRLGEKVPTIVVKRGRQGCRVKHLGQTFDVPGENVVPVDTIGAGDSFDAGFLCAYLQGVDLATCARAGNITGALSTLATGGTEAFRDASLREAFLRKHSYPESRLGSRVQAETLS